MQKLPWENFHKKRSSSLLLRAFSIVLIHKFVHFQFRSIPHYAKFQSRLVIMLYNISMIMSSWRSQVRSASTFSYTDAGSQIHWCRSCFNPLHSIFLDLVSAALSESPWCRTPDWVSESISFLFLESFPGRLSGLSSTGTQPLFSVDFKSSCCALTLFVVVPSCQNSMSPSSLKVPFLNSSPFSFIKSSTVILLSPKTWYRSISSAMLVTNHTSHL